MTTCTINCTPDFTPNFTPGPTPCALSAFGETRARLTQGILFRSILFGNVTNNITVAGTWYTGEAVVNTGGGHTGTDATGLTNDATVYTATITVDGTGYPVSATGSANQTYTALLSTINSAISLSGGLAALNGGGNIQITASVTNLIVSITDTNLFSSLTGFTSFDLVSTVLDTDVGQVGIAVSDGTTNESFGPYAQSYSATPTPTWTANTNAMAVDISNTSTLIDAFDTKTTPSPGDINAPSSSADHIPSFTTTNLTGGGGDPTSAAGIRTGPYETLIYINSTESSNGTVSAASEIRHWTGTSETSGSFVTYDPNVTKTCSSTCV